MEAINQARHLKQQYLVELEEGLKSKTLSEAEFTTLCLLPTLLKSHSYKPAFQKTSLFPQDRTPGPTPLTDFLKNYSWKGYSDRIRRSLFQWHQGHYPIRLWTTIPTPLELLKVQAQGQRVLTVFTQASQWEEVHLGKSAFEFVIHDLIHADHFFENSEWRKGQIEFYQFILYNWDHPMVISIRHNCQDAFDYLISDMNSHPQHLYQTLSALALQTRKKQCGYEQRQRLSESEESLFQKDLNYLLETRLLR